MWTYLKKSNNNDYASTNVEQLDVRTMHVKYNIWEYH